MTHQVWVAPNVHPSPQAARAIPKPLAQHVLNPLGGAEQGRKRLPHALGQGRRFPAFCQGFTPQLA